MPANYPSPGLAAPRTPVAPRPSIPNRSDNPGMPGEWFPNGIPQNTQPNPYLNEHGVDPRIGQTGPLLGTATPQAPTVSQPAIPQPSGPTGGPSVPQSPSMPTVSPVVSPQSSSPGPTVMAPTQSPVSNPMQNYVPPSLNGGGAPSGGQSQENTPSRFGSINTSITPENIYTPQMTQEAVNQQRADLAQQANMPWLLKQFARPGAAQNSPSAMGRAMPIVGQAQTGIARAGTEIPFADSAKNLNHWRSGEVAREQEAQGMAGLMLRNQGIDRELGGAYSNILSQLLSQMM